MGIFDKAKDALSEHGDKLGAGVDKAGDIVDQKTGGKYASQVDKGQDMAKQKLAEDRAATPEPPA